MYGDALAIEKILLPNDVMEVTLKKLASYRDQRYLPEVPDVWRFDQIRYREF